jgi:hypothetical protein
MAERWRVVVGEEMERWADTHSLLLDPASESWIEAPDGIIPGFQRTVFSTEAEANAAARRIRAYGYVTATEPAD